MRSNIIKSLVDKFNGHHTDNKNSDYHNFQSYTLYNKNLDILVANILIAIS